MRKFASIIALFGATLALAGCGSGNSDGCGSLSGGSAGSSSSTSTSSCTSTGTGTGTGTTQTLASVTLSSSASTVSSTGTPAVTVSATVLDTNNKPIVGVAVAFTTTAGMLSTSSSATNSSGVATTMLTASGVTATSITVTGAVATIQGTTVVAVNSGTSGNSNAVSVLTSLPQIPSDGSKTATISAFVRDASNNLVQGVTVAFSASSGGLVVTKATTDATGMATATLSPANDPSNRTITVTATAQGSTATVPVSVVGTTLTVSGPNTLIQGAQGTYAITLNNSAGTGIANQSITLASANGNTLSGQTVTTNATGAAQFTVTATTTGSDTLTATTLGLSATAPLSVSNQAFSFTTPASANTQIPIGQAQTVAVTWLAGSTPQANQTVTFSATRGTLSALQATTNAQGVAQVTISSATSGPSVITATATGVSTQTSIDFLATTANAIDLQATPSTIATLGQSTITATVRDVNDNLVQGQYVDFTITTDATGGSLSVGSILTDATGQATTVYTATSASSATNGVVITGTVRNTAVTSNTSLTVAGQTTALSLGTGNLISPVSNDTQYSMPWTVQAIDQAGNGVPNVTVAFKITSLSYLKGGYTFITGSGGAASAWVPQYTVPDTDPDVVLYAGQFGCKSEDLNDNGVLDPGEDYNTNGKLDPGLVASTSLPNGSTTDSTGTVLMNVIYPRDHANWVVVRLTATATVNGTENSTSTDILLPVLASDVSSQSTSPPGALSPYGQVNTCKSPN